MSDTVLAFLPFEPHYYVDTWAYIIILATLVSEFYDKFYGSIIVWYILY